MTMHQTDGQGKQDMREWCAGIPLVARRPLEESERSEMEGAARRSAWAGAGSLLAYPLLVIFFTLVGSMADPRAPVQDVLAVVAVVLVVVCLPIQILIARDAFRRRRGLRGDLREGYVKQFAGLPCGPASDDRTLHQLARARILPRGEADWSLEVLPISGRVWTVQNARVRPWIQARWTEVAPAPPIAAIAAQWLEPVASGEYGQLLSGQRDASLAERTELLRFARRLWLRPLPAVIGLSLWICLPVAVILRDGALHSLGDRIRFSFLAAITLLTDAMWIRAVRAAGLLRADAANGRILIVRREDAESAAGKTNGDESIPPVPADSPKTFEVLPSSRWIWTEDGRPARWRITSL